MGRAGGNKRPSSLTRGCTGGGGLWGPRPVGPRADCCGGEERRQHCLLPAAACSLYQLSYDVPHGPSLLPGTADLPLPACTSGSC